MRLRRFLAGFLAVASLVSLQLVAQPPAAQAAPITSQVPAVYIAQGIPTTLYRAVQNDGNVVFSQVGARSIYTYNALAFNPADGFLYAVTSPTNATNPNSLIRIHSDGTINVLGTLPSIGDTAITATFHNGTLYIGRSTGTTIWRVNISALTITPVTLSATVTTNDITSNAGYLWGIQANGRVLYRIDPTTGTVVNGVLPTAVPSGTYGAAWTYGNGNLAFSNNGTGNIYQLRIDNAATAAVTLVSAIPGPSSSNNDGTNTVALPTDLALTKTSNLTQVVSGDRITYTLTVTNSGPGVSSGFTISDTVPSIVSNVQSTDCRVTGNSVSCVGGQLDVGATATYTFSGTLSSTPTGPLTNTASILPNEADPNTANNTASTTSQPGRPGLSTTKTAALTDVNGNGAADLGDSIRYTFQVTNTGDMPLNNVAINDSLLSANNVAVVCAATTLAPGANTTCISDPYLVTQADVDRGVQITNVASARGNTAGGATISSLTAQTSTPIVAAGAALTIDKRLVQATDVNANARSDAGDQLTWDFVVMNTGNTTISGIRVNDDRLAAAGIPVTCTPTTLAPGASVTCSAPAYTLTQAQIDAGQLVNTATAAGTAPGGATITSAPDSTTSTFASAPSMTLDKRVASVTDVNNNGATDVGDRITYAFDAVNTGNTTLTNITVADDRLTAAGITVTCAPATLAPGASVTCTAAPYTITQADVDAGLVRNAATVSGTDPAGTTVTSPVDTTATPTVAATPRLSVDKRADTVTDVNGNAVTDAGDTIGYTFTVSNTGNTTVGNVTITDAKLTSAGIIVTCPAGPLAPGASVTCTAPAYTITAADVTAGSVANSATASGTSPAGLLTSAPDTTETPTTAAAPAISLTKRVAQVIDTNETTATNNVTDTGDQIVWAFDVTNTGNTTITNLTIADSVLDSAGVAISCGVTSLPAGGTTTCQAAPYTITQADVDAGEVTNTATASASVPGGNPIASAPSSTTTPMTVAPAITVDKRFAEIIDANANGLVDLGDQLRWEFAVTNSGTVTVSGATVADPFLTTAGIAITCDAAPIAPGQTVVCTAPAYTITQTDVDAGLVSNSATASANPPSGGPVTSAADTTQTPVAQTNALSLLKSVTGTNDVNGNGVTDAGDTITYAFTITNSGTTTATNIAVADPLLASSTIACDTTTLAPGAVTTCTAPAYTITADDAASGLVVNVATATGAAPNGDAITSPPSSTATPTVVAAPATVLVKRVLSVTDVNRDRETNAGDQITWAFDVTNTGNTNLTDIEINDAVVPATCPAGTLAPGATVTCNAPVYTITQADVDAGQVLNTATASSRVPGSPRAFLSARSATITPVAAGSAMTLTKRVTGVTDVNANGIADAGDTMTWAFDITNSGTTTLTNVSVSDPKLAAAGLTVACSTAPLAPGATVTCTSPAYTITQADQDAGQVANSATAGATAPNGQLIASAAATTNTAITAPAPAVAVDKRVAAMNDINGDSLTDAGDQIVWAFDVTNSGNTVLENVTVNDPLLQAAGIAVTCAPTRLAAGESVTCMAAPYTLTQADTDSGRVSNVATASATVPGGTSVTSREDGTQSAVDRVSALVMDKSVAEQIDVNDNGATDLGDQIVWNFRVTNTGTVTITNIVASDPLLAANNLAITCDVTTLQPDQQALCTAPAYTITQADVDAGIVVNTASATGTDPRSETATSNLDSTSTAILTDGPRLTTSKRVVGAFDVNGNGVTDAGDQLRWAIDVANTGSVTLTDPEVSDPMLAAAGIAVTCPTGALAPGALVSCVVPTYTVTAADVAAGSVDNAATATATDPDGEPVLSNESVTSTPTVAAAPALTFEKTVTQTIDTNGNSVTDAGDQLVWNFHVTNTGNATLAAISINDAMLSAAGTTISCPVRDVAADTTLNCVSDRYTITNADVDAGQVVNTASATAQVRGGDAITSAESTTTTPVAQRNEVAVIKGVNAITDVNNSGVTDPGDTIVWSFTVTNTGTTTLNNIVVNDPQLADAGIAITCSTNTLAAAGVATCLSAPFTVTAADIEAGQVTNTATVAATGAAGVGVLSGASNATVPVEAGPAMTLQKSVAAVADVNSNGFTDAGDTITWEFTVTNTGTTALTAVTVTDPLLTDAGIAITCDPATLAAGATVTCTAPAYTVTAADVQNGQVVNAASASATLSTGSTISSNPSTTTTVIDRIDRLTLDKRVASIADVDGNALNSAGDTITWEFEVTNTGTRAVSNVTIADTRLANAGITITCDPATLGVGESVTCTAGAYTITQTDVDAGLIINTADAAGTTPDGTAIRSAESSTTTPVVAEGPRVSLDKRVAQVSDVNGNGLTDAGDTIVWEFEVANTGTLTLASPAVSDPLLQAAGIAIGCDAASLAPGATVICTAGAYTVTADDTAAGQVANTATASATPAGGEQITSAPDSTSTPTVAPAASLALQKNAAALNDVNGNGATDAGDTIAWEFVVTNTGNVTMTGVSIDDALLADAGITVSCVPTALAAGASMTCTATPYTITVADVDAGEVTNTATASAAGPDGESVTSPVATATTTVASTNAASVDKRVTAVVDVNGNGITDAGDTITWAFDITNTGTTTLTNVAVTDALLSDAGVAITCETATLAAGDMITCTSAVYTITAEDQAAGLVVNTASVSATDPQGTIVNSNTDGTATPVSAPVGALGVDKRVASIEDVNGNGVNDLGDRITWEFEVTNIGTSPISNLSVNDSFLSTVGMVVICDPTAIGVGESVVCTAGAYTITQADVDGGLIVNVASAQGTAANGSPVISNESTTTTPVVTDGPRVSIDKRVAQVTDVNGNAVTDSGDTITWEFEVANTGSVTLLNPTVTDPLLAAAGIEITCDVAALAPGETVVCGADAYTVTAGDAAAGEVTNTATATATPGDEAPITSAPDSTTTPTAAASATLVLDKRVAQVVDANANGSTDAGDLIFWAFDVTNTGNATVTELTINDPMLDGVDVRCAAPSVAPGQTVTCAADAYTITLADVVAGQVANTATASGTVPGGEPVTSPSDSTQTPVSQTAGLELIKRVLRVVDVNVNGITDRGDTISWEFVVTNSGTAPMVDVTVNDPMLAAAGVAISCPATSLAADATLTCTSGAYTITQADEDAGAVLNVATASGSPNGEAPVVTPQAGTETPVDTTGGLVLDKRIVQISDGNANDVVDAGDQITWEFALTNAGNVTLRGVTVNDSMLAAAGIPVLCSTETLAPQATVVCTAAPYTITDADAAGGAVVNVASASAVLPDGQAATSNEDSTSTAIGVAPTPEPTVTPTPEPTGTPEPTPGVTSGPTPPVVTPAPQGGLATTGGTLTLWTIPVALGLLSLGFWFAARRHPQQD